MVSAVWYSIQSYPLIPCNILLLYRGVRVELGLETTGIATSSFSLHDRHSLFLLNITSRCGGNNHPSLPPQSPEAIFPPYSRATRMFLCVGTPVARVRHTKCNLEAVKGLTRFYPAVPTPGPPRGSHPTPLSLFHSVRAHFRVLRLALHQGCTKVTMLLYAWLLPRGAFSICTSFGLCPPPLFPR